MAIDRGYGIDISILAGPERNDLDYTFNEIVDASVLLQDVYKGVTTPSAAVIIIDSNPPAPLLWWEDPPVSFDIRDYFNESVTPDVSSVLRARIEQIYVDDERFATFDASTTFSGISRTLTADIRATAASGQQLRLVLTAGSNKITVESVS